VRYWGNLVLKEVRAEIGDLYPLVPDPQYKGKKLAIQRDWLKGHDSEGVPTGYLMPVAYLWTRTVKCKNPSCGAIVPLVKQTWLCKKKGHFLALKMVAPKGKKNVRFEVVKAESEKGLGFDPAGFSNAGNAACPSVAPRPTASTSWPRLCRTRKSTTHGSGLHLSWSKRESLYRGGR